MKLLHIFFIYISIFYCGLLPYAQAGKAPAPADSLENVLKTLADTEKIKLLNRIGENLRERSPEQATYYARQAFQLAEKIKDPNSIATSALNLGVSLRNAGRAKEALDYFLKALLIAEQLNNLSLQADVLHKIGVTYLFQKDFNAAMRFTERESVIWIQLNNKAGLSAALNLEGLILINQHKYDSAILKLKEALEIGRQLNDNDLTSKPLVNLGDVYTKIGDYPQATYYIKQSLDISRETNNRTGTSIALLNLAKVHVQQKQYQQALSLLKEALDIAQQIRAYPIIRNCYASLTETYELIGDTATALKYHKLYKAAEDSLMNKNSTSKINELEARYATEKKEQQVKILTQEQEIQQLGLLAMGLGVLLLASVIGLLLYLNQNKKKANDRLQAKNIEITKKSDEIERQKNVIEQINRNMTDSLNYAKHLQNVLLPTQAEELHVFTDYFVLNLPRDIVSGDFCWFSQYHHGILVVVGDCTGHGVPGALLTVICNSLLLEITGEAPYLSPADILQELNSRFIKMLKKRTDDTYDGVEMAACFIVPQTGTMIYAGAKLPLYLVRKGTFEIIKADRLPVGDLHFPAVREYTNHTFDLVRGDTFYIASDGYQDQFGGEKDTKYMTRNFRALLERIKDMPVREQEKMLRNELTEWQRATKQTDDVMILGLRI
jgi:serine phosphatase RsbU (regulator of sigma subunit)